MNARNLLNVFNSSARRALTMLIAAGFVLTQVPAWAMDHPMPSSKEIEAVTNEKLKHDASVKAIVSKIAAAEKRLKAAKDDAAKSGAQNDLAKLKSELQKADSAARQAEERLGKLIMAQQNSSMGRSSGDKAIARGDALELFVIEDESFNGVYQVRQGGYILVPNLGRVPVVGKTMKEAEAEVKKVLSKNQLVNPTVLVERPQGDAGVAGKGVVYLAGQFKESDLGAWKIPAGPAPTLVTTVIQAGMLTDNADITEVRLLRMIDGRALVEEINVRDILDGKGLSHDVPVSSGDIIYVPIAETERAIYVTGRVEKPGQIDIPENETLTAYSAILRSGGFARFSNIKKVYVIREAGGGQKLHIPVNIKNVRSGLEPDVELQGKDIVFVPEKFFSF